MVRVPKEEVLLQKKKKKDCKDTCSSPAKMSYLMLGWGALEAIRAV